MIVRLSSLGVCGDVELDFSTVVEITFRRLIVILQICFTPLSMTSS